MSLSDDDRKRILARDNLSPMDRYMIGEAWEFNDSHIMMASKLLEKFIAGEPIGEWADFMFFLTHHCGFTTAEMASRQLLYPGTSVHARASSMILLIVLHDWTSSIQFDPKMIKEILASVTIDDVELTVIRLISVCLQRPAIWKVVKPEASNVLALAGERWKCNSDKPLKTKRDYMKAIEAAKQGYSSWSEELRRKYKEAAAE